MAVENSRGCGFRKIGALYLCSDGLFTDCDRMPIPLEICSTCGQGIKQARGWTWVDPEKFLEGPHLVDLKDFDDNEITETIEQWCPCIIETQGKCAVCMPELMGEKAGLIWVGEKYYTPQSFSKEAAMMGISKRISSIPKDLVLGETWVMCAHPRAVHITEAKYDMSTEQGELVKDEVVPGIFMAFVASRVEMLVPDSVSEEDIGKLMKRGITAVPVPADDLDHI